jgi:cytidylate kinase
MPALKTRDTGVAKMVERQMRNWEIARAQRSSGSEPNRPEVEDFIAISRTLGSGGKVIAAQLGEKLGWPVFDKELLGFMAGDDRFRRQLYDSMDERDLGWLEETLRAMLQPQFIRNDYFRRLTETILGLARQGRAVFLGRGADLILPKGIGLRVGIVAPRELCMETVAERFNLTREQAQDAWRRLEQERAEFIKHHFGVEPNDPSLHDIIINRGQFSVEQASELILCARNTKANGAS